MKIPCNIVQDLLPNYIEDLCSEETKQQLGEHLQKCQECNRKYKEMVGELSEEYSMEEEDNLLEEIQPLKKIKRRHIWQLVSLGALIVITVIGAGVSVVKGSNAGFNKGYTEGTDEGYTAGYNVGTDEGYNVGYAEGYMDGTAENPNLLTMKGESRHVGEEKWDLVDNLRVVLEEERYSVLLSDMHLCLSDGTALYVVESYRGYKDSFYTIEVKRMAIDALEIEEEAFRFEALVACMKAIGFELGEDIDELDYLFMFDNALMKDQPKVSVSCDEMREGWVYENGEAKKCVEETTLEGYGAYYLLDIGTVELKPDIGSGVVSNIPKFTQVYIEMK